MTVNRLDRVSTFNDKLTFLIPHEWIEVESGEDGTYQYQLPDATSGLFRVSLITARGSAEKFKNDFQQKHGSVEVNARTHTFIACSEKDLTQYGTQIHMYYWFVGGPIGPELNREAVFSYTALANLVDDSETQSDVAIIGKLVADASFDPPDGDSY